MRCASCGFENPEGHEASVAKCAAPLDTALSCSVALRIPSGLAFCGECGSSLKTHGLGMAAGRAKPSLRRRRRQAPSQAQLQRSSSLALQRRKPSAAS